MQRPKVQGFDCFTNENVDREMTEEEYAQLLADGWTTGEEATEE